MKDSLMDGLPQALMIANLKDRVDELSEDNLQLRASILLYQELLRRATKLKSGQSVLTSQPSVD